MKKLIKIILFLVFISLWINTNASFQPIKSTLYFENINTKEITYYETISYNKKNLIDLYFLKYLDWKKIWEGIIFSNWILKEYCRDKDCYNKWFFKKTSYSTQLGWVNNNDIIIWDYNKDKSTLSKFSISDINFDEKLNTLYFEIFKSLSIEFIIFLPLNLIIFFCIWYFIYIIFSKYIKINSYIFIYTISFFSYLIVFILLYYFKLWFINFNTVNFGFMSYFMIVWLFKLIALLISKYTIEKYRKEKNIKWNFERNLLYFYLVLIVLSLLGFNLF